MKKRLLALLSSVAIGATLSGSMISQAATQPSSNFNSNGLPIVKQPITLNIFAVQSAADGPYSNMLMFNQYQKMTNINVNWNDVPQDGASEKLNLVLASNNLPDVFYKAGIPSLSIVKYGTEGTLIPLEDLISKYAPNINKLFKQYPDIKQSLTAPDGHIYALSDIITLKAARDDKIWLNKKMLNAVNMPVPKTTDQLYQFLEAIHTKFPKDIPLSASGLTQLTTDLGGAFGLQEQMGYNINISNGKVHIWLADKNYEEFLMYLHKLYQAGVLDHEVFTQTFAQYIAKMQTASLGIFFNQATDAFPDTANQYTGISPFKGPQGYQDYNMAPIARDLGTFAITSKDQYPAESIRWLDYFFSPKGSIFFRYGVQGKTFYYEKNGRPQYFPKVLNDPAGIGKITPWPGGGSPQWVNSVNASAIDTPQDQAAQNKLTPYQPKTVYASPLFSPDTATQLNDTTTTINTFVSEESAKFVTGQLSFSAWNQYVSQLHQMGLDQVQQTYQTAFDQTYKK